MFDLTGPVTATLGPKHCCSWWFAPEPVKPLALVDHGTEVRYVYECPRCWHAWWNAYNTAADEAWRVAA